MAILRKLLLTRKRFNISVVFVFCVVGWLSFGIITKTFHTLEKSSIPKRDVININCYGLITGSMDTQLEVKNLMGKIKRPIIPDSYFIHATSNCHDFKTKRGYILHSMTEEENDFPIAFSLVVFKNVSQIERLLRAIYRPQNYYCIHVDNKTAPDMRNAMKAIASCFDNVFLTTHSIDMVWGTYSILEPELICMEELWKYRKWKYFINLTGQEFPLKTNLDLVRILTAYRGANDIEATVKRANKNRWEKAGPPPHGIRPVKGAVHIIASRGYVDYLLHAQISKDLLDWVKLTTHSSEIYFSTLNNNPHLHVPGSYNGEPETNNITKPFLARFKNWGNPWDPHCYGIYVRSICIFGVGDLPLLVKARELFANKFYDDFQPYALDCIEEWHYNMTRDEYLGLTQFNHTYYETVGFVTNQV